MDFEILDPRFEALVSSPIKLEKLWTGARWSEGPAWFPAARHLVWSDIPNNRMLKWNEEDGTVSTFRAPSNNSNGNTVDPQGRLVTCEHLTRRVTRTEHDGSISVVADNFEGKRFNSPNDVVVKADGSIWFTDPTYGILTDYEGDKSKSELSGKHVYRVAPTTGIVTQVTSDFEMPNGLAFNRDQSELFISDTGRSHVKNGPAHIRKFAVNADGTLTDLGVFAECTAGLFDGFRLDVDNRVWASAADGVHCHDPDGTLIGKILVPEFVANLTFGGQKKNRLFICGTSSLYAVYVLTNGL